MVILSPIEPASKQQLSPLSQLGSLLKRLDGRERRERPEAFDLDAALEDAQAAAGVSRGDLWALGDHRLLCGDATDQGDVSRLLDGMKAAMCFTDPPYNVALGDHGGQQRGARRRRIKNDSLSPEEWEAFCRGWANSLLEQVDGALYVCMAIQHFPTILLAARFVLPSVDVVQHDPAFVGAIWFG
jgi:hypothetical protein